MTAHDLQLLDVAYRALQPTPNRMRVVPNPLDRCDVCEAPNTHGEFFTTQQNGRPIALCDACR